MYSVVLMMALSGGAEATEFGRNGCNGGGCYGNSCYGGGCHGGGGLFSRHGCNGGGGLFRGGHGCNGSCYGGGCYGGGCYGGGCHGGGGGLFHRRNNNCCGCQGGGAYYGCQGGGCYGGGCQGGVYQGPGYGQPPIKDMPVDPKKEPVDPKKKAPAPREEVGNVSATILVTMPAEGTLKVDGRQTTSTGASRTLITPALPVGQDFTYTLEAQITRDGRPVVQTQTITVRGGETTAVPFTFSSQSVASR